jgi:hypothetical protein
MAACAWGGGWASRSRISRFALIRAFGAGEALGGAKGEPQDLALCARIAPCGRSMRRARRVTQVCVDRGITRLKGREFGASVPLASLH